MSMREGWTDGGARALVSAAQDVVTIVPPPQPPTAPGA